MKLYSSKNLGACRKATKKRLRNELRGPKKSDIVDEAEAEESSGPEEEFDDVSSVVSLKRQLGTNNTLQKLIGKQSYDYIDKIKEMYSNKAPREKVEMQNEDDDNKKEVQIKDERLEYINKFDSKKHTELQKAGESRERKMSSEMMPGEDEDKYKNRTSKVKGLNQDTEAKLPIIFHEREIMENIENNVVTIVCGETGSGKST